MFISSPPWTDTVHECKAQIQARTTQTNLKLSCMQVWPQGAHLKYVTEGFACSNNLG